MNLIKQFVVISVLLLSVLLGYSQDNSAIMVDEAGNVLNTNTVITYPNTLNASQLGGGGGAITGINYNNITNPPPIPEGKSYIFNNTNLDVGVVVATDTTNIWIGTNTTTLAGSTYDFVPTNMIVGTIIVTTGPPLVNTVWYGTNLPIVDTNIVTGWTSNSLSIDTNYVIVTGNTDLNGTYSYTGEGWYDGGHGGPYGWRSLEPQGAGWVFNVGPTYGPYDVAYVNTGTYPTNDTWFWQGVGDSSTPTLRYLTHPQITNIGILHLGTAAFNQYEDFDISGAAQSVLTQILGSNYVSLSRLISSNYINQSILGDYVTKIALNSSNYVNSAYVSNNTVNGWTVGYVYATNDILTVSSGNADVAGTYTLVSPGLWVNGAQTISALGDSYVLTAVDYNDYCPGVLYTNTGGLLTNAWGLTQDGIDCGVPGISVSGNGIATNFPSTNVGVLHLQSGAFSAAGSGGGGVTYGNDGGSAGVINGTNIGTNVSYANISGKPVLGTASTNNTADFDISGAAQSALTQILGSNYVAQGSAGVRLVQPIFYGDSNSNRTYNFNTALTGSNNLDGMNFVLSHSALTFGDSNNMMNCSFAHTVTGAVVQCVVSGVTNNIMNLNTNGRIYVTDGIFTSSANSATEPNQYVTLLDAQNVASSAGSAPLYFVTNRWVSGSLGTNIGVVTKMSASLTVTAQTNTITTLTNGLYFINRVYTNPITQINGESASLYSYVSISGGASAFIYAHPEVWLVNTNNGQLVKLGTAGSANYPVSLYSTPQPVNGLYIPYTNTTYINTILPTGTWFIMLRWMCDTQGTGPNAPSGWSFYLNNGYGSHITVGNAQTTGGGDVYLTNNQTFSGINTFTQPIVLTNETTGANATYGHTNLWMSRDGPNTNFQINAASLYTELGVLATNNTTTNMAKIALRNSGSMTFTASGSANFNAVVSGISAIQYQSGNGSGFAVDDTGNNAIIGGVPMTNGLIYGQLYNTNVNTAAGDVYLTISQIGYYWKSNINNILYPINPVGVTNPGLPGKGVIFVQQNPDLTFKLQY